LTKTTGEAGQKTQESNKLFAGFVITLQDVVYGVKKVAEGLFSFAKEAGGAELSAKKLADAMKAQGIYSDSAYKANLDYAESLMATTKYSHEEIEAVMKLLTNFGLHDEQLRKVTASTLDFATKTGSLESAAMLLGKATEGVTGRLSMHGIVIDENIPKSKRLDEVIKQIQQSYGNTARGEAQTFLGKLEQLKIAIDEQKESIGEGLLPELKNLVDTLKEGTKFSGDFLKTVGGVAKTIETSDEKTTVWNAGLKSLSGGFKSLVNAIGISSKNAAKYWGDAQDEILKTTTETNKKVIANDKLTDTEKLKISNAEKRRKIQEAIEAADLAADTNLKIMHNDAIRYDYTAQKEKNLLEIKRSSLTEGSDAYKKYTDAILALDSKIAEQEKAHIEGTFTGGWNAALKEISESVYSFKDAFLEVYDTMNSSLSTAFSDMILEGATFSDSMNKMFTDLGKKIINVITDMMAQSIIKQFLGMSGIGGMSIGAQAAQSAGGAAASAATSAAGGGLASGTGILSGGAMSIIAPIAVTAAAYEIVKNLAGMTGGGEALKEAEAEWAANRANFEQGKAELRGDYTQDIDTFSKNFYAAKMNTTPILSPGPLGTLAGIAGLSKDELILNKARWQSLSDSEQAQQISDAYAKYLAQQKERQVKQTLSGLSEEGKQKQSVLNAQIAEGQSAMNQMRFASGVRNFIGGLALVGENGPEILNLPGGSDVFSNSESKNMLSTGMTFTIIANGPANKEFARQLSKEIFNVVKTNRKV
jgi:hypothetical protein